MLSVLKDTHTPPVQVQQVQANARFCALENINHFIDCEHFRSQAIFRAIHKNFGAAHRLGENIAHIKDGIKLLLDFCCCTLRLS
jgi:hypothetical protein